VMSGYADTGLLAEYQTVGFAGRLAKPFSLRDLAVTLHDLLAGVAPAPSRDKLCLECKRRGTVCVMAAHGTPCLGPVTQAGCGALCPSYQRGCYGCFGPAESPNTASLGGWWQQQLGATRPELVRAFRTYNAYAAPFRIASDAYEHEST